MSRAQTNRRSFLRFLLCSPSALVGVNSLGITPADAAIIAPGDSIKVTRIETFVLRNSWVFVKISTDAGITGWGEMLKDDAKACAAGVHELENDRQLGVPGAEDLGPRAACQQQ